MAVSLPNGSRYYIASGEGSALTVSAVTNASPAVCTSTAHGLANGDYVRIVSGWSKLSNKVYRVANVATNTFELEGTNTSSTTNFPAGSGIGSAYEITGWTELDQILSTATAGGEQQYATYQFLADDNETRIPTNKSAQGIDITVADDPSLAGYILASTANDDRVARAVQCITAASSKINYYAYISLNKIPTQDVNQVSACRASLSMLNEPVRYAT